MTLWVVIYQTNTGFVYGWLCKANQASDAIEEYKRMIDNTGKTIRCIAELKSEVVEACFSLYAVKE